MASRKKSHALRKAHIAIAKHTRGAEMQYELALRRAVGKAAQKYADRALALHAGEQKLTGVRKDSASFTDDEFDDVDDEIEMELRSSVAAAFDRMATQVVHQNGKALRMHAGPGLSIDLRKNFAHLVGPAKRRNLELIDKAMVGYGDDVRRVFRNPDVYGMAPDDLRDLILERADVTKSRASLIARDQTLKLNGAVTRERQTASGIDKYIWSTSLDGRVRDEHKELEALTFSWNDPPEPGHPGEDFQCRCVAIPVLPEDDETDDE